MTAASEDGHVPEAIMAAASVEMPQRRIAEPPEPFHMKPVGARREGRERRRNGPPRVGVDAFDLVAVGLAPGLVPCRTPPRRRGSVLVMPAGAHVLMFGPHDPVCF